MRATPRFSSFFAVPTMRSLVPGFALAGILAMNFLSERGHDFQRSAEVLFLMAVGIAAAWSPPKAWSGLWKTPVAGRALIAFFALGAVSATLAFSPRHAWLELSMFLLLLTTASMIADAVVRGGHPAIRIQLQMAGLACALHAVKIVVNYVGSLILGTQLEANDFAPGFSNIRFFNHTQTALLPLLTLMVCLSRKTPRLRYFWTALLSLWWLALFATSGRGTMVGLMAGCAFAGVVLRRAALPYLKAMAFTALSGVLLYGVFLVLIPMLAGHEPFGAFESALSRSASDPGSRRGFIWANAIDLIRQHPVFGVGPMHFAHDAARFHWAAHPHDWILQIGAEWGVPAMLCLALTLFLGMRALVRTRARAAQAGCDALVLTALLTGGGAILVDGLVSGLIVMPQSQLAIALYLGLAIGWYRMTTTATLVRSVGAGVGAGIGVRIAKGALLLAAVACVTWGVFPDIIDVNNDLPLSPAGAALNQGQHWPRLWEPGFF